MMSRIGLFSTITVGTTTGATTPWPLQAPPGALRLHALPRFGLGALNGNQRRSTVDSGTGLKIMVSPVRVQVPPLLFSSILQGKFSALSTRLYVERGIHHNGHHDGRSFEVLREAVVEAHGGLAVHGGGSILGAHLPHGFLPVARQQATPRFAAPDRIAQPPARGGRDNTGLSASRPAGTAQRRRRPP